MGATCCSSDGANSRQSQFEINTLEKLAQQNTKQAIQIKQPSIDPLEDCVVDEFEDTKSEPNPPRSLLSIRNATLDYNVVDFQLIEQANKSVSTNSNLCNDYNIQSHFYIPKKTDKHCSDRTDAIFMRDLQHISTNNDECKSVSQCSYIKRVISALKYYHSITNKQDIIAFCSQTYTQLLDDYHHILFIHEHDIDELHHIMLKEQHIAPCNINKCESVRRNQRHRDKDNDKTDSAELTFWTDLFDSIHCHLLHIYDYGYRIKMKDKDPIIKQRSYTSDDVKDNYCIDVPFAVLKETIVSQRNTLNHINGWSRTNTHKYNMPLAKDEQRNKRKEPTDLNCGLRFYYWDYYKHKQEYVESKYCDMKEEIMNNTIYRLDMHQYEKVLYKSTQLMNTEYVKKLKADFIKDYHYDIENNASISLSHIISIVLYVDYEILSMELKKTFSAMTDKEQMFSIKNRHREYCNWSKRLRETVQLYGTMASKSDRYYIGCKYVVASSLSMRFRSPTSMSTYLEVTTRFITDMEHGMILELNGSHEEIKTFDCKWLSYFSGENEHLFMGRKYKLTLRTIRFLKTNTNLCNYMKAIYYFDLMLSGVKISSIEAQNITKYDYKFLNTLIAKEITDQRVSGQTIGGSATKRKDNADESSAYLKVMFHAICAAKDIIVIDLILVNLYYKKLQKLIIDENISNLVMFNYIGALFANCRKIAIYATTDEYVMDLRCVLNEITKENCTNFVEIRIRCKHQNGGSWLCNSWNNDLEFEYHSKKWKATLVIGKGSAFDDVLTLSKQKKHVLRRSATSAIGKVNKSKSPKPSLFISNNSLFV